MSLPGELGLGSQILLVMDLEGIQRFIHLFKYIDWPPAIYCVLGILK